MSQQGATLQTYNQELVKCIEDIKRKRADLNELIIKDEEDQSALQKEIEKLSYKLTQINDSLSKKIAVKQDYDRTIAETESAYTKIIESSQVLLNMARREATNLDQAMSIKKSKSPEPTMSNASKQRST